MKKKQYIVQVSGINKRQEFVDYIKKHYQLYFRFSEEYMINSKFPFVVDFKKKDFWVCESITCCACAAQNKKIITLDMFKKEENS